MKQRKLVIGLLVTLAIAVSGFTFAFWAGSVGVDDTDATGTVTIGQGNAVTTSVEVGPETSTGSLVPYGLSSVSSIATGGGTVVEYVLLTFSVQWVSTDTLASGVAGTLAITIGDRKVGSTAYNSIFLVSSQIGGAAPSITDGGSSYSLSGTADNSITTDGAAVNVYILLQMTTPANQTEYNAVANQNVVFNVNFATTLVTP